MAYEWDPAAPSFRQRVTASAFLVFFGLTLANAYFEWRVFGEYGRQAVIIVTLLGVILMSYFMPSARHR